MKGVLRIDFFVGGHRARRARAHRRLELDRRGEVRAEQSEMGLDQYKVRSCIGWQRHMTLAITARSLLAITRAWLFADTAANENPQRHLKKSAGDRCVFG